MNKIPVYASTGAFITRKNNRDYHLIAKTAPRLHADGVEFMMYESWDGMEGEIARELKENRVSVPVMHMDKTIGDVLSEGGGGAVREAVRRAERDIKTAAFLGAEKLVLHLWNGPLSDGRFDLCLSALPNLYEISKREGILLTVENVICKSGPALLRLLEIKNAFEDACFTYDTKMAHLRGENEMLGTNEFSHILSSGAIRHLHVNDSSLSQHALGRLMVLHPGEGDVDFKAFFSLVKEAGFTGSATVESTSVNEDGSVQIDKLNKSLAFARLGLNG
ncbi:MAG: sugar phosphate isomerase/epimerase [Clostridia bacterium]|nr:sugar phosphate isomerase/epimerase [Clostridia bacterium]